MSNYIDTRDLIEERDSLKQNILDSFNETFNTELEDFEDISEKLEDDDSVYQIKETAKEDFLALWENEYETIAEIDDLENEVGDEFEYGVTLIPEYDFENYVEEFITDCGYISKDFPAWITIDWSDTADNVKQDYTETTFRGRDYLFRS